MDGQTDKRTDILPWHSQRYAHAWSGKNCIKTPVNQTSQLENESLVMSAMLLYSAVTQ